jgi:hypothetical protein
MECPNFPTVPLREERRITIILFYYLTFALMVPQAEKGIKHILPVAAQFAGRFRACPL